MILYNKRAEYPKIPKKCVIETYGAQIKCSIDEQPHDLSLVFKEFETSLTSTVLLTLVSKTSNSIQLGLPIFLHVKVKNTPYSRFNKGATMIYNAMFDDNVFEILSPRRILQRIADKISTEKEYIVFDDTSFLRLPCETVGENLEVEIDTHYCRY